MDEIKPFKTIPLIKYFQHDLEKIKMALRLSDTIQHDLKNLRAAGDEVELSVKDFFKGKLFPKYHVCDGHIIDSTLKASPQFDIIICENSKNPVLFNLSDKSELVYFETVYCFGEVKKSFYKKSLLEDFAYNVKRTKLELSREPISPTFIESSTAGFHVEDPVTTLPYRNPLLTFMIFVKTTTNTFSDFKETINKTDNKYLPNFIVLLDAGIIININKAEFESGKIKINLYPEFETEDSLWVMMDLENENNVLIYQFMLIIEHLNNAIVSIPDLRKYTNNLFDLSFTNFHEL